MEFRVLGPVEVWSAGEPLAIGGSKPRALLAALVLGAGHVVSVSPLLDVVWGTEPPATAPGLVQTYVSALRRQLRGDLIETRPPGYVLRAGPDDVDHLRFQRLVAEARTTQSRGDNERAARLFHTALGCW